MHPLRFALPALCALALIIPATASAETFTVDSTVDDTDVMLITGDPCATGFNGCTLRAAIQQANVTTGPDNIILPSGTYTLTLTGSESSSNNDLDITSQLTITGTGPTQPVIDGNGIDRVFHINAGGNATIENVRVTGGSATTTPTTAGGGFFNQATLLLRDSQVSDNETTTGVDGSGIYNDASGTLTVQRTLIHANVNNTTGAEGGGIYNNGGSITIAGSTIDGNSAQNGGAIFGVNSTSPVMNILYSTITNNTTLATPGFGTIRLGNGTNTITGSIVSGNTGAPNCSATFLSSNSSHNIDNGTSCGFTNTAQGDKSNADPLLGGLADNGGSSFTRLPQTGSPAIDGGAATGCENLDQRSGFTRPSNGVCDIGAVETAAPPPPPPPPTPDPSSVTLDVDQVTRTPGDPNTIVATALRSDGTPFVGQLRYSVVGANPVSGLLNTDLAGRAANGWDGVHDGADVYTVWVDRNGNGVLDVGEPADVATVNWVLPTPQVAKTVNLEPGSGRVFVRLPANAKVAKKDAWAQAAQLRYVPLEEAANVPVGSIVDARRGRVELTSSSSLKAPGKTQTAQFYSGAFQIGQIRSAHPVTEVKMTEQLTCPKGRSKVTAARAKTRRLWGKGKGRFRTRGRHSSASVRGTTWYSKDDCKKTTTVVREGTVIVQDFGKKKNIRLTAGGRDRYIARGASNRNK